MKISLTVRHCDKIAIEELLRKIPMAATDMASGRTFRSIQRRKHAQRQKEEAK